MTHRNLDQDAALQLFHSPSDDYVDVGAGAVAYRCVGRGPDVLFVHGGRCTAQPSEKLLPALAPA